MGRAGGDEGERGSHRDSSLWELRATRLHVSKLPAADTRRLSRLLRVPELTLVRTRSRGGLSNGQCRLLWPGDCVENQVCPRRRLFPSSTLSHAKRAPTKVRPHRNASRTLPKKPSACGLPPTILSPATRAFGIHLCPKFTLRHPDSSPFITSIANHRHPGATRTRPNMKPAQSLSLNPSCSC
ncbi:hypothetical protein EX30DRAFT_344514 [Ascodesmis nigricans]|uniref:Uncharacterized protein n=1 Tax=Ascodesmis nigricans TaxID=341454 RepID=A0A4V3SHN7_9PEZI|nr:hypothetical protein EX30DRAFT_344514 [Ascodesmis nigricans]